MDDVMGWDGGCGEEEGRRKMEEGRRRRRSGMDPF